MSSKLSMDILSIIFEDLEQENDKTLYSCIFVNREWCQVAIPFLWKNPWNKFYKDYENDDYRPYIVGNESGNQRENQYKILFKCFLKMIPKGSKEFLKTNGINLDTFQNNSSSLQTPLFNYSSFCKVIDSCKIHDMVDYNLDDHQYLVGREILKLLISNTSKLKILILYQSHPIASFPNSSLSLSQLNEFHCDTSMDIIMFYELSQLCRNIERLVIKGYIDDDNHGLIFFIKQQINLKRVKIWNDYYNRNTQGKSKYLCEALATKISSIIELDFGGYISIPPIFLKKFQNNLSIFKFGINLYDEELENMFGDISLPNLQQLIIHNNYPFDIIGDIIEKTNGKLKKIIIDGYDYDYEDSYTLISTIAKHCPKLELLAIWVDEGLNGIFELINECKNLRGLVLRSLHNNPNIGKLFKMLYNNAPNQLRKLQFDRWRLSKEVLNEFFENWSQKQRNSLDFYVSSCLLDHDYKDIIKKYQEQGVIRKFDEFIRFHDFFDSWEESVCSLD